MTNNSPSLAAVVLLENCFIRKVRVVFFTKQGNIISKLSLSKFLRRKFIRKRFALHRDCSFCLQNENFHERKFDTSRLCMSFQTKPERCEKFPVNRASKTSTRWQTFSQKPRSYFVKPHRKRLRTRAASEISCCSKSQIKTVRQKSAAGLLKFHSFANFLNYLNLSVCVRTFTKL